MTKPLKKYHFSRWIRKAELAESIRLVQNQWCRDNGYALRGKYRTKCVQNKANKPKIRHLTDSV